MEIKVNDYVRTKSGCICKIININDFREPSMKYGVEASYLKDVMFIGDEDIVKSSPRIIDLIEVEDYVNGKRVNFVYNPDGKQVFRIEFDVDGLKGHMICETKHIKSIVTKEQFERMEYKVN